MGRPRKVSDSRILEAARAAFIEHGPSLSTVEIARLVGLSQAALFQRFGTKKELMLHALMPPAEAPFVAHLERGPDDRPIGEQLLELATEIGKHFDIYVPCWSVLRAVGMDSVEGITGHAVPPPIRSQQALASWLRAAAATNQIRLIDAEATAILLLGALQTRSFFNHLFGSQISAVDQQRYLANLVDVIMSGIAPRSADDAGEPPR